jgi:subtilase family serine protease
MTATPLSSAGGYTYYTPQEIRSAYGINQAALPNGQAAMGAGQTIAIVDAYHNPNIQSDLATFDSGYGLAAPPSFRQVQMGGVTQVNTGWAGETALDVEWAHAVAPQAKLLLVEAASASYSDLLAAVRYAASQPGVVAVSMSWGGSEFYNETSLDSTFTTPAGHGGVTFVASSGDNGAWYGAQWPAVSPNVLAVGGTSLNLNGQGNYASESAWSDSGGGYSIYEREPSFQRGAQNSSRRSSPDVAYDANPSTGVVVYNSVGLQSGYSGWWIFGGTSAGAPQWAGVIALADQARGMYGLGSLANGQTAIYSLPSSDFHDVSSGSNGYYAMSGYDLATGRGSPVVNRIVSDLTRVANSSAVAAGVTQVSVSHISIHNLDEAVGLPADGTGTKSVHTTTTTAEPAGAEGVRGETSFTADAKPNSVENAPIDWMLTDTALATLESPGQPTLTTNAVTVPVSGSASDHLFQSFGATCWKSSLPGTADEVTHDLACQLVAGKDDESSDSGSEAPQASGASLVLEDM